MLRSRGERYREHQPRTSMFFPLLSLLSQNGGFEFAYAARMHRG
jgi:hypothetical protein